MRASEGADGVCKHRIVDGALGTHNGTGAGQAEACGRGLNGRVEDQRNNDESDIKNTDWLLHDLSDMDGI